MLPQDFVYLDEALPGARWDSKYAGSDNFMGRPAQGYRVNRIVLTCAACSALRLAQARFRDEGLDIFVFDAYRPARAVADFCAWARDARDVERKSVHYPHLDKMSLLREGYIAEQSGHSRGSAIDLTLCTPAGACLDMGGIFDYMDPLSWHGSPLVSAAQTQNREMLRRLMLQSGFCDYDREWWHYRLRDEPYPDTYFDFEIE